MTGDKPAVWMGKKVPAESESEGGGSLAIDKTESDPKQKAAKLKPNEKAKARPNVKSDSAPVMWDMQDVVVCICSNPYANSINTGFWDMWFTMSGAAVFTPCVMSAKYSPAEVALADFCQTRKIDAATHVIALVNKQGNIEPFMIPWINHALGVGKKVFTDIPLNQRGERVSPLRLRGNGLLKELYIYSLTKETFEAYLDLSEDEDERVNPDGIPVA